MPAFWEYWDRAQGQEKARQASLFRQVVGEPNEQLYAEVVGDCHDKRVGSYLDGLERAIPAMRRLSDELPARLEEYWASFVQEFEDLKADVTLYLMPSLYAFDGQVRPVQGQPAVLFGVDTIAAYRGTTILSTPVFPHHEFFHLYHARAAAEVWEAMQAFFGRGEMFPLYYLLWEEGLAIYASKVLNPMATMPELLSSHSLAAETQPLLPQLTKMLRDKLDSVSREDIRDFFFIDDDRRKDIPARCGYYVGMLIAEELANKYHLRELARLQGQELRHEIGEALEGVAHPEG